MVLCSAKVTQQSVTCQNSHGNTYTKIITGGTEHISTGSLMSRAALMALSVTAAIGAMALLPILGSSSLVIFVQCHAAAANLQQLVPAHDASASVPLTCARCEQFFNVSVRWLLRQQFTRFDQQISNTP
jgi:hypothetical protein